ncbi:hypothetical protein LIA77_05277 [Sarocladium implicatum]|nr:hypothetical protein LIA77_05277 [Sarocladium implicatum]
MLLDGGRWLSLSSDGPLMLFCEGGGLPVLVAVVGDVHVAGGPSRAALDARCSVQDWIAVADVFLHCLKHVRVCDRSICFPMPAFLCFDGFSPWFLYLGDRVSGGVNALSCGNRFNDNEGGPLPEA